VFVLFSTIMTWLCVPQLENSLRTATEKRIQAAMALVQNEIDQRKWTNAEISSYLNVVQKKINASDIQIALYDTDRKRLAGSGVHFQERQDAESNTEDWNLATEAESGVQIRYDPLLKSDVMSLTTPLGDGAKPAGFLRSTVSLQPIQEIRITLSRSIWSVCWLMMMCWFFLSYLISHYFVQSLERLTQFTRNLGEQSLGAQLDIVRNDEIGPLNKALNAMSSTLQDRFLELQLRNREIESNSEQLTTVLESMVEGVIAVDNRERIVFANPAARDMVDLPSRQILDRPIWELVRNPAIQSIVRHTLQEKRQFSDEFNLPRSQSAIKLLAAPLSGDPCPGVVLVLQDVTELRKLENLRREFVSNVSHELKTPLASIQALTETLMDGAVDDPDHNRRFLAQIEEHGDRLESLILDLLHLAKIEGERELFDVTEISINQTVESCLEAHQAVADAKQLTLTSLPSENEIFVKADEEGLRIILDNLIDNAVNYTPERGRVTVRWIAVDDQLRLQVEDTGPGIADEHLDRIFERFYRVDKARSREVGGTGLGLSIVKHLTQVFGGSVEVESELGRGSTFRVLLPLNQRAEATLP